MAREHDIDLSSGYCRRCRRGELELFVSPISCSDEECSDPASVSAPALRVETARVEPVEGHPTGGRSGSNALGHDIDPFSGGCRRCLRSKEELGPYVRCMSDSDFAFAKRVIETLVGAV